MRRAVRVLGYAGLAALVWCFAFDTINWWSVDSVLGWVGCVMLAFVLALAAKTAFSIAFDRVRRGA